MQEPTMEEVEAADRLQLAKWYRFLPCGADHTIINRVVERFLKLGGMSPTISKQIGWDQC